MNSVWYPSSGRSRIYRGDLTFNGLTSDDYWYMTSQPTSSDGCAGYPASGAYPDTSDRNWQETMVTNYPYVRRDVTGLRTNNDGCLVFSTHEAHVDAATPPLL